MTKVPAFQIANCITWNEAARLRALKQGRRRDVRRFERNIKDLKTQVAN